MAEPSPVQKGLLCGAAAYGLWGVFPIYFKLLSRVPALEVLAHRILWSAVLLGVLVAATGAARRVAAAVGNPRTAGLLLGSTLLVSTNWFVFIRAVAAGQVLESSLGYFINPLVSVVLGFLFLGERLARRQWVGVGLAGAGVLAQTVMLGRLPAVALVLAGTFALYGLVRKVARIDAVASLTVEMALLSPAALGLLLWREQAGVAAFLSGSPGLDALLLAAGVVTTAPLLLFGAAMGRLRLSTMGVLQYLVPTLHFALAVFAFGEPFSAAHLVTFGCIWAGLVAYSWDALAPWVGRLPRIALGARAVRRQAPRRRLLRSARPGTR
ncbi:MAG: EamA family transporter RarD [Deferrisomatales bacterium]